jgi:phage terminase large subunit-like protein
MAPDAVELAAIAGLTLDPWQDHVLQGALGYTATGRHSAPEVGLVVPRQNGKTALVEVVILAAIFLARLEVVYTAHLMATSRRVRARIQQLIESTPDLEREVKQIRVSNEEQSIELKSRARIDFGPVSVHGPWLVGGHGVHG